MFTPQPSSDWQAPDEEGPSTSFFEFWPTWLIYAPVVAQWILLAIRYRSLTLPLIANPRLPLSGMVGVPKSELMRSATGACRQSILPWVRFTVSRAPAAIQAETCLTLVEASQFTFPFVCKPDIGCRGAGVKLVHNQEQLEEVLAGYPSGASLLCQKLANWEPEAGIFYVRNPGSPVGEIVSLTFKYTPFVMGDGVHTLQQLIEKDPRAGQLQHLYRERHLDTWHRVLPKGQKQKLVFSASHCRGAVFRDARKHITAELTAAIDALMSGLPDFHYGRLDVKFASLEDLKAGCTLEIVEINGASAESIHIWDKNAPFFEAVKTLLWQYRTLFRMGAYQRRAGYRPPGIRQLLRHWRIERRLTRHYPSTD